jgi:hypothetical protein
MFLSGRIESVLRDKEDCCRQKDLGEVVLSEKSQSREHAYDRVVRHMLYQCRDLLEADLAIR